MANIKNGKKPLSERRPPAVLSEPDFFGNQLVITNEVKAELERKGLEYRFIDYKKYVSEGNQHNRGWKVQKLESLSKTESFLFGDSPDGIIRRGSLVLAVRPIEQGDKHRAWIQSRQNVQNGRKQAMADELRAVARQNSLDTIIDDSDSDI
jgi:hypothetical protein